jgi:thiol-disulfide isomerase/thioredoxin
MINRIYIFLIMSLITPADYPDGRSRDEPVSAGTGAGIDKTLAERIASFKGEIEARTKVLSSELAVARTADGKGPSKEIKEVLGKYQRDCQAITDKLTALVRDHPAAPAALEGILLLGAECDDDILEIVRERFMNDSRLAQLCTSLSWRMADPLSKKLLTEIAIKSPDRQIRGEATYSLGLSSRNRYQESTTDRRLSESDQDQLLSRTHRRLYKQMIAGRRLSESDQDQLLAETQRYFEQVVRHFPDVTSADGKFRLADKAKAELLWIANIPGLKVGKVAPGIVGEDLDGKPLKLDDYRGKVVVLVFWATWCAPCMAMVPHERELVKRMRGRPFVLIGINANETDKRDKARKSAHDEQMNWPSFWDGVGGPIQLRFNIDKFPTIYVLDPGGVIRYLDVRGKDLDRAVDALLLELETGSKRDANR